jgi:hypothetical protein
LDSQCRACAFVKLASVAPIRLLSVAVFVLIGLYFVMRAMATACAGPGCDVYIPISALIPLVIFVVVIATGVVATMTARSDHTWFSVLVGITVLGVAGPLIGLLVFKDSPDAFVATGTAVELLVAVAALVYTFVGSGRIRSGHEDSASGISHH